MNSFPFSWDSLDRVQAYLGSLSVQGDTRATAGVAICSHLDSLGVKAVLCEQSYVDRDYSRAFENFYGRFFRPPSKLTTRYHFFRVGIPEGEALPADESDYLGFVVVWPTDPPIIGRTALRPPEGWVTLAIPMVAHIGAQQFTVSAVPYATKDFGVSACATIATWLATEVAGPQLGIPLSSSFEITQLATSSALVDPRSGMLPQRFGLDPEQIGRALLSLGYQPFVYDLEHFHWQALGTIFGCLSSGLPVILMVEFLGQPAGDGSAGDDLRGKVDAARHAVLAIGMRIDKAEAEKAGTWAAGLTNLLIHDDRYGPYVAATPERGQSGAITLKVHYEDGDVDVLLKQMIVPLPPKTYTISADAHIAGVKMIGEILARGRRAGADPGSDAVLCRTTLVSAQELKNRAFEWGLSDPPLSLAATPLPHRVWLTEAWRRPVDTQSEVTARVVMDASVLRDASFSRYLWGHFGNEALDLNAWENEANTGPIEHTASTV